MLRSSLNDFKLAFTPYLLFEFIYTLFSSVFIAPVLIYIFNQLIVLIGQGDALLNSDVYQLGLSFNGVMIMFAISILAVAVLFVEFGVIIIIAQKIISDNQFQSQILL